MKHFLIAAGLAMSVATAHANEEKKSAEEVKAKPAAPAGAQAAKKKASEVSFEDLLVQGKYHFADEAVTTVESDKILDGLLGVRTDFKDRLKKSASRQ